MRTKNFFKGLAVAAVALVGVFATSCSEEELNFQGTPSTPPTITPTELPDGVAYAAISVVDLGDLGLGSKVLYTETKDVTALNGTEIECPDFDGMEEYVIPAAQKISVPTLLKGQTVTIPMTFYVVKTTSAFAHVEWDIEDPKEEGLTEEGLPYVYGEPEVIKGSENEKLQNLSNYWKNISVRYSIPYAYFVSVLGETEAPEGGEGEGEGTEGEEGEGTEGEEGEGEEAEGEVLLALDFEDGNKFFNHWGGDGIVEVEDGALKITNEEKDAEFYTFQVANDFEAPFVNGATYKMTFKVKGSVEGSVSAGFQVASTYAGAGDFAPEIAVTTEWTDIETYATCTSDEAARLIFNFGHYEGVVYIDDFKLELTPSAAARAAATTAEEIVAAYVKNIVMPEQVEETWSMTSNEVTLFSGGCVDFTKTIYSNHPTYVFTYLGEEVEVTFEQIIYASGMLGAPYAIPGHESEYSHSEGHGHFQHDQHGNDMNAGGGIVSFE